VEPAFFLAQVRADLGQIFDEDRALLCTGKKLDLLQFGRGFRWWDLSMGDSQQTLNCALSVDLI